MAKHLTEEALWSARAGRRAGRGGARAPRGVPGLPRARCGRRKRAWASPARRARCRSRRPRTGRRSGGKWSAASPRSPRRPGLRPGAASSGPGSSFPWERPRSRWFFCRCCARGAAPSAGGPTLPAWEALPAASDDGSLDVLRGLALAGDDLEAAATCRDLADCLSALTDEESLILADALQAAAAGGPVVSARLGLLALAGLASAPLAWAQPPQGGRRPPGAGPRDDAFRMVDAYIVSNLQESVGLTDEQFVKVLPLVKRFQQERRETGDARRRALREMRALLQAGGRQRGEGDRQAPRGEGPRDPGGGPAAPQHRGHRRGA